MLAATWLSALLAGAAIASELTPASTLKKIRADRRATLRKAVERAVADSVAAPFGLLVIPVDFADRRLPRGWESHAALGPRLFPLSGETLANYYRIASRERLELKFLLAPLVHLPGQRRDYSDIDLGGNFSRTRRLATEALESVARLGLDFRLLDMDGPDRRPGSDDDDGQVDGVLILHAGPGEENDPENGLIQALSFFLLEPVVSDGVSASLYAVASLHSGLGVWAHEAAHLLGLEDRYDPFLAVDGSETAGRGGLGIFSLMAAGAFGTGDGSGAALVDAFSAAQLGWCDIKTVRGDGSRLDSLNSVIRGGEAWRLWTNGRPGPEYFLLETRGDPAAAPFDAAIPSGQLLVYHIDENLPERQQSSPNPPRHIRVALLEADGDRQLADGNDRGRPEDLFPGPLQVASLTPSTIPSSAGYGGPTEISLTDISSLPGGVALRIRDSQSFAVDVQLAFTGSEPAIMELKVVEAGLPLSALTAAVEVVTLPAWGSFAAGALRIEIPLARSEDGIWRPAEPVAWQRDTILPAGASTGFLIELDAGDWRPTPQERLWVWRDPDDSLDFAASWPGEWEIQYPGGNSGTTWHRWADGPYLTRNDSPVLICTGSEFTSSTDWDAVSYTNGADAVLVSGPLPAGPGAILIVHAIDADLQRPGVAWDAGLVEFLLADGSVLDAEPVDGYGGLVDAVSRCSLHGRAAFAGLDSMTSSGPRYWRADLFELPNAISPLRLRLRFASDTAFRGRGWVLARLELREGLAPESAFPVATRSEPGGSTLLTWSWPGETPFSFAIEASYDQAGSWRQVWTGWPVQFDEYEYGIPLAQLGLPESVGQAARLLLRVVADVDLGGIVSRPIVYYRDGGAPATIFLAAPYPNPAAGDVRLLMDLPAGEKGRLSVWDLRGRLVRRWDVTGGGSQLLLWDGNDERGRRAASGFYTLRLETRGRSASRQVVLVR